MSTVAQLFVVRNRCSAMAKGSRPHRRTSSKHIRSSPYSLCTLQQGITEGTETQKYSKQLDNKDWIDATCSVCMECPHNAVLLLCSSHDNGCRPYMCGTSFRYSNCLDQYKKAYTKFVPQDQQQSIRDSVDNANPASDSRWPVAELACPLCRGQVKGWTVVEPAREFLNAKKRNCMQDQCTFIGTFKELRKHMRVEHPCARPREVDPTLEQQWRRLERERERDDVISTIRSTMPGALVFGDYVIEGSHNGFHMGEEDETDADADADAADRSGGFEVGLDSNFVNFFFLLHAFGPSGGDLGRHGRQPERTRYSASDENSSGTRHSSSVGGLILSDQDDDNITIDDDNNVGGVSLVDRLRRHGRVLLGRSGRRRRRRESNGSE